MALDISVVTNAFDADVVIVAVLAIAGVLITIAALLVACLHVMALIRGDDWARDYLSPSVKKPESAGIDALFEERYKREKLNSDYRNWKKSKGY